MCLKEEGTNDVISCPNEAFCFAVLGGCVRAGKAVGNAIRGEKRTKGSVGELATVVALHGFNHYIVLGVGEGEEALESGGRVGFMA